MKMRYLDKVNGFKQKYGSLVGLKYSVNGGGKG